MIYVILNLICNVKQSHASNDFPAMTHHGFIKRGSKLMLTL